MNYGLAAAKMVELDKVFLDTENPRHKPKENQPEAIEALCESEQIATLAEDIAQHGLNPLELFALITEDNGKTFIVIEGNRRLCALMLLNDPQRAPAALRKRFERAAKNWTPIPKIFAVVFDDLEAVRIWRDRIHGGPDEGRGRRPWDPEQKARNTSYSKNDFAQAVLDYAQSKGLITEDERKQRISTVQKYLANPKLRETIGLVGTDPNDLRTNLRKTDFMKIFRRFIRDVADKKIDTRSGRKAKDIEDYARKIQRDTQMSGKKTKERPLSGGRNTTRKTKATRRKVRKPTPPTKITSNKELDDALSKTKNYKLQKFYYSLTAIDLKDHTPLMYVAAWAFIETLAKAHGAKNDFCSYLSNEQLKRLGFEDKENRKTINQALSRISGCGNTTKHHGKAAAFNAEQLANDFEVVTPVLTKLAETIK